MRPNWTAAAAVGMLLAMSGPSWAGIYFTNPKDAGDVVQSPAIGDSGVQPLPLITFQNALGDWRNVRIEGSANALRKQYLAGRDRLQEKVRAGAASVDDRINLSAFLIRLGQADQAIPLLENIARGDRQHATFMVYANLGTAYQLNNELASASNYLQDGLDSLKRTKEWPGIDKSRPDWERRGQARLEWFGKAEKYQLDLVRIRRREATDQPGGRPKPPENVDDLFKGVRFVGESGAYQAGHMAAAERAKLPKNALAMVQQLLLWMPDDARLLWLMGELLNAQGDVGDAGAVLDECSWSRGLNAAELRQHRQVLEEARRPPPPDTPHRWMPETGKLLAVGVGAGLLVALLLYWQVREFRRKRSSVA